MKYKWLIPLASWKIGAAIILSMIPTAWWAVPIFASYGGLQLGIFVGKNS